MPIDLAAIPASHDAPDVRFDAGIVASVIGLAAVVKALAPLLGALDGELRDIIERAQAYFPAQAMALAN